MEAPHYDVVNPLWQRGRAFGQAEERERIIELLKPYTGWSGKFEADGADIIAHIRRVQP